MQARPYQLTATDSIQLNQVNLCVAPMRAGKSFIMKLMIDKYQFKKVLIVIGYRKIVQQLSDYFPSHTHILSGLPFDHSQQVHLASFQTLSNRDIDLSEYDCIIQDEYHSRTSQSAADVVFQPDCTTILFTGTPLTNRNKLLVKGIDNFIQPVTIKELIDSNWLAPTRFLSNSNIIGDHAKELSTTKQDFDESIVRQIILKEDLLNNIVQLIDTNHLDTQHKTLIYVNYIETADQLHALLANRPNVFVVHSKLSNKQQESAIAAYQSADSGVLINVRALSLGFDSPTTDTLIYATFTKIHSLCLQILWRASTINPADSSKVATVYDMTGQLAFVNPYTDFKSYSKKLTCKEQCIKQYPNDKLAQYFCIESCKSDPILVPCNGSLAYSLIDNEFVSNFQIHSGKPCKESRPVWDFTYKQTEPGPGLLRKWSKCNGCGTVTSYDVKTLTQPSDMVEVYSEEVKNHVILLLNTKQRRAFAIFDGHKQTNFTTGFFSSSGDVLTKAASTFSNEPFSVMSNLPLSNVPNSVENEDLNPLLNHINWDTENPNTIIKQVIKQKFAQLCEEFIIKPGYVYFNMKHITSENEKKTLELFNKPDLDRAKLIRFFKKFNS